MPYPGRPVLDPLPQFRGTAVPRPDPVVQGQVEEFIVREYRAGRSLRELAELTDRSWSAVRTILNKHQVPLRPAGAARMRRR